MLEFGMRLVCICRYTRAGLYVSREGPFCADS